MRGIGVFHAPRPLADAGGKVRKGLKPPSREAFFVRPGGGGEGEGGNDERVDAAALQMWPDEGFQGSGDGGHGFQARIVLTVMSTGRVMKEAITWAVEAAA